jgi:poly(A) polymerase
MTSYTPHNLSEPFFIVQTLRQAGFQALYAGGWVRDYLLGRIGSDVDIATDATPEQVALLFEKTVPVGAAFGVMLVVVEGTPYEVATFRKEEGYCDGRHPDTVEFADAQEDAQRRDFTINGMFWDPIENRLLDYVEGRQDLSERIVRAIGDPKSRFEEDHLRILRGVRFATTLGFTLEEKTATAIQSCREKVVQGVSPERISQELSKMAYSGKLLPALQLMQELDLLKVLFPGCDPPPDRLDSDLPLILQLCSLYRTKPKSEWVSLAERLKMSGEERRIAETLQRADALLHKVPCDRVEWAHFLAKPWAEECLEALAFWSGPYPVPSEQIQELQKDLEEAAQRIAMRDPIVQAGMLAVRGVPSGPQMGELLRAAERLSIEEGLEDPEEILERLPLPRNSPGEES